MDGVEAAKRRAGRSAASTVDDGDVVGLGTGSTAAYAIKSLADRIDAGLDIQGVATSYQARTLAVDGGIPLVDIGDLARIDVAIDGADQIAGDVALKGGGGAHTMEKIVATAADRFLLVVDDRKRVPVLDSAVPLAVLPGARTTVGATVRDMGGSPEVREATQKDGPVVTDNGNLVLDCAFGEIDDPESLASSLDQIPGVVEHGLFVGVADELHVGDADEVTVQQL